MGRVLKYRPGSWYRQSDRTGFPTRAENTRKEWTGIYVENSVWEPRQPQDLVQGGPDNQSVPDARPLAPPIFVGVQQIALSDPAVLGDTFIGLESIAGLSAGDQCGVMLDNGAIFRTTISGAPVSAGVNIAAPLPSGAAEGNLFFDYAGGVA